MKEDKERKSRHERREWNLINKTLPVGDREKVELYSKVLLLSLGSSSSFFSFSFSFSFPSLFFLWRRRRKKSFQLNNWQASLFTQEKLTQCQYMWPYGQVNFWPRKQNRSVSVFHFNMNHSIASIASLSGHGLKRLSIGQVTLSKVTSTF